VAEIRPYANVADVYPYLNVNSNGSIREVDSLLLLDRDITFAMNNAPNAYGRIRLYFTEAEMQRLKSVLPALAFEDIGSMHIVSYCKEPITASRQIMNPVRGRYGKDYFIEIETGSRFHFYLYARKLFGRLPVNPLKSYNLPNAVTLQWETMKETNIGKFIIESSRDSVSFQAIAEISASSLSGQTDSTFNYTFTDGSAIAGITFYRIKSIGNNEEITYSSIYKSAFQPVTAVIATSLGYPVQVQWQTEIEINNKEFVIERSIDNVNFTSIGTVLTTAENGNSSSLISYSYIDSTPVIGMNYYRVRQVDNNANINYSDVAEIMVDAPDFTVHLSEVYDISSCSAMLSSIITVQGGRADSIRFEYGINDFSQSVPAAIDSIISTTASVDAPVTGLLSSSLYKFRTKFYFNNAWHYSDETIFNTADLITPEIMLYDGSTICDGGSLMLSSTVYNGNQWLLNGQEIDGAIYDQLEITQPGQYTVFTKEGCPSPVSAAVRITTASAPAIPQIQTPDGTSVCDGKMVSLFVEKQDGMSYQWMRNGVVIRGADQPEYLVTSGADYHVEVTNTGGCTSVSSPLAISVLTAPDTPVISLHGAPILCEGDSVYLSSTDNSYWYRNGIQMGTSMTTDLKVGAAGSYHAVSVSGGCKSAAAGTINITVKPLPAAVITSSAATTFCEGGKLLLQASETTGNSYQWLLKGMEINNATSRSYEASASGKYQVFVTNNGCSNVSPETEITVKALPAQPSITVTTNTLSSSAAAGNQWLLNGVIIAGATGQQYTVQQSGKYSVIVTKDGCTNQSAEYNFVATGIVNPVSFNDLTIYPNPLADQLTIGNEGRRKLHLRLTDAFGRTILETKLEEQKTSINLRGVAPGNYMLIITDLHKKQTLTRKLIKL
jgi:hypothetical protein